MNKLIPIFLLTFLLAGCITDMVKNPDAVVKNSRDNGYVAFSTVCESDKPVFMYYGNYSFNFARELIGRDNLNIAIRCDTRQPQYVLLNLPTGVFDIKGFGLSEIPVENAGGITFSVLPRKVVYLGRFYIKGNIVRAQSSRNVNYGYLSSNYGALSGYVADKRKEDIAWFLKHYQNISRDSYVINVLN